VVAALALMTPELLSALHRPRKAAVAGASTLKLVQFNLWAENHDPAGTAAWILAQNADIVITEEPAAVWPVLRALTKAYPYHMTCRAQIWLRHRIFSRWPVVAEHRFYEEGDGLIGAWATAAPSTWRLHAWWAPTSSGRSRRANGRRRAGSGRQSWRPFQRTA
jgi:endonuclease/exonuclease/phosphatase (EEP) superfamily protein YafD